MSRWNASTIAGATLATVAVSGLGYALYFDYKRRNDPDFRRALFKEKRKLAKASQVQASREKASQQDALRQGVRQMMSERPPQSVEERESYFLEQVAIGEALAAKGPAFYVPAAISFFKGLQVYPQPQELLMIYSKTQPAEVVQLLMEALKMSISDESMASSASASARGAGGRGGVSGPLLEEIDTDSQDGPDGSAAGTSRSRLSSSSGNGSAPGGAAAAVEDSTASTSTSSPTGTTRSFVEIEHPGLSAAA